MASKGMIAAIVIVIIGVAGAGAYLIMFNPFGPQPNPYTVAIVFATGGLGDKSFNDGCYNGAVEASQEFGIQFTYSEPAAITDYEGYIRGYAEHTQYIEPFDLIISVGFDQADALMEVAADFPDQKFAIVDMYIDPTNYSNVASLLFNEHEGSALVGAIAGLMTTTDSIGFVGGMDIPLIHKFAAGYVWGANYTNPGINYQVAYTGSWVDTAAGKSLADGMYSAGVDIIFAAAGRSGLGVFDSAKENNATSSYPLWVIGVDSPQMYLGCADPDNPEPPTVGLTSMLKRVDVAVHDIIEDVVEDTFSGGVNLFTLANGGLDYEINTDLLTLPTSVINAVEDLKAAIIAGTVTVPDSIYWS